jgi:LmbE family N-acetylglucosaminyl deacetylase
MVSLAVEEKQQSLLKKKVKEATKALDILSSNLIIYRFQVRKLNYVRQEVLEELVKIKKEIDPHAVFLPSLSDLHQDHHTIATEGMRTFKKVEALKAYESQSHEL